MKAITPGFTSKRQVENLILSFCESGVFVRLTEPFKEYIQSNFDRHFLRFKNKTAGKIVHKVDVYKRVCVNFGPIYSTILECLFFSSTIFCMFDTFWIYLLDHFEMSFFFVSSTIFCMFVTRQKNNQNKREVLSF